MWNRTWLKIARVVKTPWILSWLWVPAKAYCLRRLKGRLHNREKIARIRQKLERFQWFLQRNSELLSVPCRIHRRLWTRCGTDKSSLFLCKNCWNRSSFCRIRAIFAQSCKRPNNVEKPNDILQLSMFWAYIPDMSFRYRYTNIE